MSDNDFVFIQKKLRPITTVRLCKCIQDVFMNGHWAVYIYSSFLRICLIFYRLDCVACRDVETGRTSVIFPVFLETSYKTQVYSMIVEGETRGKNNRDGVDPSQLSTPPEKCKIRLSSFFTINS